MTDRDPPVSENDLHAYVDGWLTPERRAAVERHLERHADDAALVRAYRGQTELLRAACAAQPEYSASERLRAVARTARGGWRIPALAATAAVLLFMFGLGGGWALRGVWKPQDSATAIALAGNGDLPRRAAAAHRVYAVEVRHPVEVRAEEAHLMAWLSKRVGRTLAAPDLDRFGFRLMGGRLLPAASGAAAQLMYEDGAGRRVSVYVQGGGDGIETAFHFFDADGLSAFYWLDGPFGYALVGPLQRNELFDLAQTVYQQLDM